MPKEFTHWTIAEQVRRARWTAKDRISEIIVEYPNMYLLGAIAHDSMFYPVFMPRSAGYEAAARNLHVEDITGPFRAPAPRYGELFTPPAMAFLAGAVTHIAIDGIFHPFIHYFSGDSGSLDPAIAGDAAARHRTLETFLDLYFYGSVRLPNHGSLLALLRDKEMDNKPFYELAARFYGNGITASHAETALRAHAKIVYLAQNRYCVSIVNFINTAAINAFKSVRGLCYPKVKHFDSPFFDSPVMYKNPVTGEECTAGVTELRQRSVTLINAALDNFSRALQTGGDIIDDDSGSVLQKEAAAVEKQRMSHFDLSRDIEAMLATAQELPAAQADCAQTAAAPAQTDDAPEPETKHGAAPARPVRAPRRKQPAKPQKNK
ncbi:MAG: zinc dependent phospholipase C family protein [Elusimicrobiaceae bacterium]|nr:zinc dependent phospholipase C family protein [Elusimicrobiaceae bacterium]